MKQTSILTSRIDSLLKDEFTEKARSTGLTPSSMNELLIKDWVKKYDDKIEEGLEIFQDIEEQVISSNQESNKLVDQNKSEYVPESSVEFVLHKLYSDGKRETNDSELKKLGINIYTLPYFGRLQFGKYILNSKSFWKETWSITKTD